MLSRVKYRNIQNVMLFLTVFVLVFSFYIEFLNHINPCPLCIMQRFCAFLFGLCCMISIGLSSLHRVKITVIIQCVLALLGLYFAGRQLWLQSLPVDQTAQCMPGIDALVHYFSWVVMAKSFLWGSGDCSRVDWQWFGLSLPLWSALYYGIMLSVSMYMYRAICQSLKNSTKFD